jgi:hypothetical protein
MELFKVKDINTTSFDEAARLNLLNSARHNQGLILIKAGRILKTPKNVTLFSKKN